MKRLIEAVPNFAMVATRALKKQLKATTTEIKKLESDGANISKEELFYEVMANDPVRVCSGHIASTLSEMEIYQDEQRTNRLVKLRRMRNIMARTLRLRSRSETSSKSNWIVLVGAVGASAMVFIRDFVEVIGAIITLFTPGRRQGSVPVCANT